MDIKHTALRLALAGAALYVNGRGSPLKRLGPARVIASFLLMRQAGK